MKKAYFWQIYSKELWKSLESFGLKFKSSISKIKYIENHAFEVKDIVKDFTVFIFRN